VRTGERLEPCPRHPPPFPFLSGKERARRPVRFPAAPSLEGYHTSRPGQAPADAVRHARSWRRNAGLRIDHLLLNPAAARLLAAAGVDRDVRGWGKTRDHAPAWVVLRDP